jgi:hypothetical protein
MRPGAGGGRREGPGRPEVPGDGEDLEPDPHRRPALPKVTEDEIRGKLRGIQRFGEPGFYDKTQDQVLEEIRREGTAKAEIQAIFLDDFVHVSIPAEYFVQHGLRIKEETHPFRTRVVGYANGMVGYVPHKEAFARGGYETTFGYRSKLAPEAGDLLADAAIALVRPKK